MATNPYAKWATTPEQTKAAMEAMDQAAAAGKNPYAIFAPAEEEPAKPQTPEELAAGKMPTAYNAPPGTPLDQLIFYEGERNRPEYDPEKERAKRNLIPHVPVTADDLRALRDATVRPLVHAVSDLPMMPLDAATNVRNFIMRGDFSPKGFYEGLVYGPGPGAYPSDIPYPSHIINDPLDRYTQAPTDTAGRVAEAISSGILGSKLPGTPAPPQRPPVLPTKGDAAIVAGQKHDVPVFFDDVSQNPIIKKVGVGAENVPIVGTSAGRAQQAAKAGAAAERITGRYTADLEDEVPVLMQESMQRRLKALQGSARLLYTRAANLLDQGGNVPSSRFDSAIHHELARQEALGTAANQRVVDILSQFDHAPRGNFSLMRDLRSQIGDAISDFYTGGENRAIGEKGVERLREMRQALEADMSDFANKQGGEAARAWRDADSFWKTNLLPFKQQGFADLVRTGEPEKAWKYLLAQNGIDSRVTRMYNGLDTQGRAAVRAGMFQDAMAQASGPKGFSPARFAKYMEDNADVVNHFFHGNELEEVRGFTNLMRHVERAGQYMENPPTGQRLIGALMLGSTVVAPKALAVGATTAGGVRVLFQTKAGRDLLIAASRLKPGGPAMNAIADQVPQIITRTAASAAAANNNDQDHLELAPVGEVTGEPADAIGQ